MAKELTIVSVKCIRPSAGIDGVARTLFGAIGAVAGGAVAMAGTVASGGLLIASTAAATYGGASAGVVAIDGLANVFGGEDELYLKANGNKLWPGEDMDGVAIKSQQTIDMGLTVSLVDDMRIDLMEYDYASGDDHMGYEIIKPAHQNGDFTYLITHEGEGSIYNLNIRVSG